MSSDPRSPTPVSAPNSLIEQGNQTRSAVSGDYAQRIAELFRSDHDRVVHYLVARTGSWAEARDVAAQAFKQMLEVDPATVTHLKAYVYTVARNIATNRAKLGAIRRRLNKIATSEFPHVTPSPEIGFADQQRLEVLRRAIAELSPRCRMALVLRVWDELPYADILGRFAAQGVIVNERTVRRWVEHAHEHCRQRIVEAEQSGGRERA